MALLMVMTVCLLVYAALAYRIRHALKTHNATFPDQKGKRVQNPTARWVFHYFVGIHLLSVAEQWPLVLNLTEEHGNLLKLLGKPYMQLCGMSGIGLSGSPSLRGACIKRRDGREASTKV
jgi:hypothetical protein